MFCASQASTAICLSMNETSSSISSNALLPGERAIDRHNPIIRESRREVTRTLPTPCSSQPPISPKPYRYRQKTKRSSSSKTTDNNRKASSKENDQKEKGAEVVNSTELNIKNYTAKSINSMFRRDWVKSPDNLITPPGSSRYLLSDSDTGLVDGVADGNTVLVLAPFDNTKARHPPPQYELRTAPKAPSNSSQRKTSSSDQVVVLRVSLHCKGCEGKVRKHLSKMEGVTSFNIDFAAKKVTIVGNVTPLGVLTSVSKVKNARFWSAETEK